MDIKIFPENVDVTLIEGAVANEEQLELLKEARGKTKILISLGDCAVTGNVTALRNGLKDSDKAVLEMAYIDTSEVNPQIPTDVPKLLKKGASSSRSRQSGLFHSRMSASSGSDKLRLNGIAEWKSSEHGGKIKVWLKKQRK